MRFLADVGVSPKIIEWLREHGHDATGLRDEGLHKLPDSEIYAKAIEENRIVLTFDLDFGAISEFFTGQRAGVVVFRLRNPTTDEVIVRLKRVLRAIESIADPGFVITVQDARYRVRRFPRGRE